MRFLSITIFAAGLLISSSEGAYFPYANLAGVVLLIAGAGMLDNLNKRGML